jgi:hypothetical protein
MAMVMVVAMAMASSMGLQPRKRSIGKGGRGEGKGAGGRAGWRGGAGDPTRDSPNGSLMLLVGGLGGWALSRSNQTGSRPCACQVPAGRGPFFNVVFKTK